MMKINQQRAIAARVLAIALAMTALAATPGLAQDAQESGAPILARRAIVPLIDGWFDGQQALYLSTESSDASVAQANGLNYVPRLANAANTQAVDQIYTVTNFKQSNIIPSRPKPAGPGNQDTSYSPLWQLVTVTWANGVTPHLLTSEMQVLAEAQAGKVAISQTNIIINCPVVYTPSGGRLPHVNFIVTR